MCLLDGIIKPGDNSLSMPLIVMEFKILCFRATHSRPLAINSIIWLIFLIFIPAGSHNLPELTHSIDTPQESCEPLGRLCLPTEPHFWEIIILFNYISRIDLQKETLLGIRTALNRLEAEDGDEERVHISFRPWAHPFSISISEMTIPIQTFRIHSTFAFLRFSIEAEISPSLYIWISAGRYYVLQEEQWGTHTKTRILVALR